MEKRLMLAIVLSFVVVLGANLLTKKNIQVKPKTELVEKRAESAPAATPEDTSATSVATTPTGTEAPVVNVPTAPAVNAQGLPAEEQLKEVSVKTALFTATFSNLGARLKSFKLNEFKVTQAPDSELIDLISVNELTQLPLDVAFVNSAKETVLTGNELYSFTGGDIDVTSSPTANKLVFNTTTASGLRVQKTFTFSNDRYNIDLDVQINNISGNTLVGNVSLNWREHFVLDKKDRASRLETFAFSGEEVERDGYDDLDEKAKSMNVGIKWHGMLNKFFLTAVVPEETAENSFYAGSLGEGIYLTRSTIGNVSINSGENKTLKYHVYVGPKKSDNLKKYNVGLQGAISFGFFNIIAIPLMEALKFFYRFTNNYGFAIIIITVIIKMLFYPLTQKSYKAMKDMQKISPLINELKEKYKDDKERLNKEVLELYKRHRVNPVGGCFPILLQMPVFFALYQVLLNSVELRHAPFILWITDLSSKDPYYVTPVIMGVTMLIQQKMSPSASDANQKKIMMIMPVVFTFMFLNFPAGLVVYWLVNNILSIAQQAYVAKKQ